jgi:Flp pilus assembly protein TadG
MINKIIENHVPKSSKNERNAKGQSLVEFAVSAMIMLLLIAGIADLGRAFFSYMAIRDAAQEGAAYGSTYPDDLAGIENRVRGTSQTPVQMDDEAVKVFVEYEGGACEGAGNAVKVTVEYDFRITTPLIGVLAQDQSITLRTSVSDTILRPPCP